MNYILLVLKGMFIGGTMLIPGVSGGTMAMAIGVYQDLISSIANIRKAFKKCLLIILPFAIGGILGAVLLSSPIEYLLNKFHLPTMYFFLGSVVGGVPLILKKAFYNDGEKHFFFKDVICLILGIFFTVVIGMIPEGIIASSTPSGIEGILILLAVGFICSIALILPGISTSYLLLIFGIYDSVLIAFSTFDVYYLLPLVIGALIGIVGFSKFMESQMRLHPRATYVLILGFVIGSILQLYIKPVINISDLSVKLIPQQMWTLPTKAEWVLAPVLFIVAYIVMFLLSKIKEK